MKTITKKKAIIMLNKISNEHTLKHVAHSNASIPKIRIKKDKIAVKPIFRTKREEQRFSKVMSRHAFSDARLY